MGFIDDAYISTVIVSFILFIVLVSVTTPTVSVLVPFFGIVFLSGCLWFVMNFSQNFTQFGMGSLIGLFLILIVFGVLFYYSADPSTPPSPVILFILVAVSFFTLLFMAKPT